MAIESSINNKGGFNDIMCLTLIPFLLMVIDEKQIINVMVSTNTFNHRSLHLIDLVPYTSTLLN